MGDDAREVADPHSSSVISYVITSSRHHHITPNQENPMSTPNPNSEEVPFSGDTLLAKIKELIRQGNIRRVIIKNEEGRVLIDIPLTFGVVGTLIAPQLAAIGAIAALVLKGSIVIEKQAPDNLDL
jgi:hypothetical protein